MEERIKQLEREIELLTKIKELEEEIQKLRSALPNIVYIPSCPQPIYPWPNQPWYWSTGNSPDLNAGFIPQ